MDLNKKEVFRKKEAAKYLGVATRTIERMMADGALRFSRVGGVVLIRRNWCDETIDSHEVATIRGCQ